MTNKFAALAEITSRSAATAVVPNGRRSGGKRSNPDYRLSTVYLKKKSHKDAVAILHDKGDGDFSDLMQELLEEWVGKQKK